MEIRIFVVGKDEVKCKLSEFGEVFLDCVFRILIGGRLLLCLWCVWLEKGIL